MILLLDSSTPLCKLTLVMDDDRVSDEWQADRELAKHLLTYLEKQLEKVGASWNDVQGIGVMKGPGSFTGLRIGVTVMNTLADTNHIPIVGTNGEDWQHVAILRLKNGEDDKVVLPEYGRQANITKPRK